MDGDSATSSGLEWQNLALYSNKPMQIFGFPSSNELYPVSDNPGRDFGVPDPTIGLRLGHQKEYGEAFSPPASSRSLATTPPSSSMPVSSTPAKRSRASYHNMQNPCCQVEGCNLDLKLAKDYHRRHRICESHSKSPKVIVAGMERRFCQQCSRFHDLSEFDDKKRSCRRRLSDHNARRRRVQPESIQLSSPGISPALYADQRQQNVLLNGLPVSLPSSTWENASSSMARHSLMRPSKVRGLEGTLNDDVLHQCLHVASNNSSMAPDLMSAHSLLSSTSWSLNEGESSSMEGIVQGSYAAAHSEPDSHHLTLFQSHNVGLDQGPPQPPQPPPSMNMQNAGSSHHQEYQLFKPPYHSGSFYSTQRSL